MCANKSPTLTRAGLHQTITSLLASRRLGRGTLLLARVVSTARPHLQVLVPGSLGLHLHRTIAASALRRRRLVLDGVLVANVVRNLRGDSFHLAQVLGEERNSTGVFGHLAQGAASSLAALVAQQADGVDGRAILLFQTTQCLLQRLAAGIVFAVGHH